MKILPPACPQKGQATGTRPLEKLLTEAKLISQFIPLIGPVTVGQEDCLTLDVSLTSVYVTPQISNPHLRSLVCYVFSLWPR